MVKHVSLRSTLALIAAVMASGVLLTSACSVPVPNTGQAGAVRVATISGISSLPIQVAIEQGFFKNHDLDVQLTEGTDVAAWQSALGKQFDIVLSNAASYTLSIDRGLKNSLVNGMVNATSTFAQNSIAAREPLGTFSELRGKTIGVPTLTGLPTQTLEYLLRKEGLTKGDYQLVSMPYGVHADNLSAGNVDAVLTAKPHDEALARAGFWVDSDDICVQAVEIASQGAVDTCSSVVFAADSAWADGQTEVLESWIAGLTDAVAFIEANPEAATTILQTWTGYSQELLQDTVLPDYELVVPREQLEPVWEILVANQAADGPFPAEAVAVWETP